MGTETQGWKLSGPRLRVRKLRLCGSGFEERFEPTNRGSQVLVKEISMGSWSLVWGLLGREFRIRWYRSRIHSSRHNKRAPDIHSQYPRGDNHKYLVTLPPRSGKAG